MKIVFLGTPEFAVASLEALSEAGHEIAAVVTAPDKPAGRGRKVQPSAVKEYAIKRSFPVLQPSNLKDENFLSELRSLNAEVQVVVAFRMLPEAVWNMPRFGTFNVHASLLPSYRGAAPINRAIMDGATETGVTIFRLKHAVDTGSILLQEKHPIGPDTTAGELHDALMHKGAALIVEAMRLVEQVKTEGGTLIFTEQDDRKATHAPKIFREDCELKWSETARSLHNRVRGLSPFPGAFTYLHSESGITQLKVLRSALSIHEGPATNGSLYTAAGSLLSVRCADGWLDLLEIQMEGKRRMAVSEFLKGYRLSGDERLGAAVIGG